MNHQPPRDSVILKILIIGDACVGKTSLVQRYVNGTFTKAYRGTIGVDFALKILEWDNNEKLKIQLWDIAGQERFSYMTRVYYRDAHGCVIMFDLTNRSSFLNVVKWKRDFDSKCLLADGSTVPCILLANKADQHAMRQVSKEELEKMSQEFQFTSYTEISVKDNFLVDDAMRHLLACIMNRSHAAWMPSPSVDGAVQKPIKVEAKNSSKTNPLKGNCC